MSAAASRLRALVVFAAIFGTHVLRWKGQQGGTASNSNSKGICDSYDGILHISQGDGNSATATTFFVHVINQLQYAEKYNQLPWVHLNDHSRPIYDPAVHSKGNLTVEVLRGAQIGHATGEGRLACFVKGAKQPRPVDPIVDLSSLEPWQYTVAGTGVWTSYFEAVIPRFPPSKSIDVESCRKKPLLSFTISDIYPGFHKCTVDAVRSWAYRGIPQEASPNYERDGDLAIHKWLGRHRRTGHGIWKRYDIQLNEEMSKRVDDTTQSLDNNCLAMHIRMTDKGNGRQKVPLETFRPYAEAFIKGGGKSIFVATDDAKVLRLINTTWPQHVASSVYSQTEAFHSETGSPTFVQIPQHRGNIEALLDIYSMAKCSFFVHGFSAMAEAVAYLNLDLHNRSVNVDDGNRVSVDSFEQMVVEALSKGD